jgi:radical SAM superfamily enzyme YgiQ (UPF0313 family)
MWGKSRPTLLLINPRRKGRFHWDMKEVASIMGKKVVAHPLALPLLAALTPPHWQVRIIDEEMTPLLQRERPDLVGITAMISNITRAYEIADSFRSLDVPVVMGGPHVSYDVPETLRHADAVLVGEAEGVWSRLLEDFEAGALKREYRAEERCSFRLSPVPRWDLLDCSKILSFAVQVSRGCPHQCDFCLVHELFGRKQRYRDLDNVMEEILALPGKQVSFADDNLTADKTYARELCERLIPRKLAWSCQAGIDVAYDKELLSLMARSGCQTILIGFESLDPACLAEAHKGQNKVSRYAEAVANLHAAGIHPIASFVAGFEADTLETFDRIKRFVEENNLSYVMISALGSFPGSRLHQRMTAEGRVTPVEADLITGMYPNIIYRGFTQAEMFRKGNQTVQELYSYSRLLRAAPAVLGNGSFIEQSDPGLSLAAKFRCTLKLAARHLPARDPDKRKLFIELFKLVKDNRAAPAAVVQYLMFIDSFRGFLETSSQANDAILERLVQHDSEAERLGLRPIGDCGSATP